MNSSYRSPKGKSPPGKQKMISSMSNPNGTKSFSLEQKLESYIQRDVVTSISNQDKDIFTQFFPLECNNLDYFRQIIDVCCQCMVSKANEVSCDAGSGGHVNVAYAAITNLTTLELLNELSGFSVIGSFASLQRVDGQSSADASGGVSYRLVYPTLYCRQGTEIMLEQTVSLLIDFLDQFRFYLLHGMLKDKSGDGEENKEPQQEELRRPLAFHQQLGKTCLISRLLAVFDVALGFTRCFEPMYDPNSGTPVSLEFEPEIKHQLELFSMQQQIAFHRVSKNHRLVTFGCTPSEVDVCTAASLFDGENQNPCKDDEKQAWHEQMQMHLSGIATSSAGSGGVGGGGSPLRVTDFDDVGGNEAGLVGPVVTCSYTPRKVSTLHSTTTNSTHVYKYNLEQESLLKTVTYVIHYMRQYAPTAECNCNNSSEIAYTMLLFRLAAITIDLNYYIHYHATDTFNYPEAHRLHALNLSVDRTLHISLLNDTSTDSMPLPEVTTAGRVLTEEEAIAAEATSIAPILFMGHKDFPSLDIEPKDTLPPLVYGKQRLHTVFELIRIGRYLFFVYRNLFYC
jgi:hypothetical protein